MLSFPRTRNSFRSAIILVFFVYFVLFAGLFPSLCRGTMLANVRSLYIERKKSLSHLTCEVHAMTDFKPDFIVWVVCVCKCFMFSHLATATAKHSKSQMTMSNGHSIASARFIKHTHAHTYTTYTNWVNRIVSLFSSCCFLFLLPEQTETNMQKKSSYNHAFDVLLILVNGQHVFSFFLLSFNVLIAGSPKNEPL